VPHINYFNNFLVHLNRPYIATCRPHASASRGRSDVPVT